MRFAWPGAGGDITRGDGTGGESAAGPCAMGHWSAFCAEQRSRQTNEGDFKISSTGCAKIYGSTFEDESFDLSHDTPGVELGSRSDHPHDPECCKARAH